MNIKKRIRPFYQLIPDLLLFQFVSFTILTPITGATYALCNALLRTSGTVAVTSGNLGFLFTHWQGYAIIALLVLLILVHVAIELNALVLYCDKLLSGKKASILSSLKNGFIALKKYRSLHGFLLIVYAVFLSPLLGFGLSISLTSSLSIPNFIMSVIVANPLLLTLLIVATIALAVRIIINCFIVHGALLNDTTLKKASLASQKLIKKNLRHFIKEMLIFAVLALLAVALPIVLFSVAPLIITQLIPMSEPVMLFSELFFASILFIVVAFSFLMSLSFLAIKLSTLYKKYQNKGEWNYVPRAKRKHPVIIALMIILIAICAIFSFYGATNFNELFRTKVKTELIGHRAGGAEAPENTVRGIEVAYELGATGCEIDIQRTKDGHYVVNHDSDFSRVAGVDKTPAEMTLDEIKQLRVDGEPIPTLEETLEASRDKVTLYVELKGDTADEQMADDAVRIIKEYNMQNQAVLISLKYDLMEYVEQKYPEMLTGYLAFISLGQIENTSFDYLSLEEQLATKDTIAAIHDKGKKVLVWTVNEEDDIRHFLTSDADAIVTDQIKLSRDIKKQLPKRNPLEVILQATFY
ncbi:glycerophosphoryl diester phosphodiesterase membrane domain-containing protein [Candidatus Saccharibacteria bacterium]|nr:glycerophosphoryl diester phosphodiesterase membrane domain-containing protein [Candidatus Saccharibacteria bacterium]